MLWSKLDVGGVHFRCNMGFAGSMGFASSPALCGDPMFFTTNP